MSLNGESLVRFFVTVVLLFENSPLDVKVEFFVNKMKIVQQIERIVVFSFDI